MSAPHYQGRMGDTLLYRMGECSILLGGPVERGDIGWHFSIAHPTRHPTWEEQKLARYALVPDYVTMISIMPPKSEYVSLHPNCFHWWEINPDSLSRKALPQMHENSKA